jgi:hypothetical protein
MIRTACRIIGWLILLAIIFATVSPIGLRPRLCYGPDFDRFIAFLASGLFLGFGYRRRWLWAVGFIAIAAFGIETLQMLTPDRHARFWDAAVKAGGGILGVLAAHMVLVLGTS